MIWKQLLYSKLYDYEEPNMTREDAFRAFKDPQGEETEGARLARGMILNDRSK